MVEFSTDFQCHLSKIVVSQPDLGIVSLVLLYEGAKSQSSRLVH